MKQKKITISLIVLFAINSMAGELVVLNKIELKNGKTAAIIAFKQDISGESQKFESVRVIVDGIVYRLSDQSKGGNWREVCQKNAQFVNPYLTAETKHIGEEQVVAIDENSSIAVLTANSQGAKVVTSSLFCIKNPY